MATQKEREIQEIIEQFRTTVSILPGEKPQAHTNRLRQMAEAARRKTIDAANAQRRSEDGAKGGKIRRQQLPGWALPRK